MTGFDISVRLHEVLALDPAATALQYEGAWHTWGDLARIGQELRVGLASIGAQPSANVGVIMSNRPEIAAATVSLLIDGHSVVTLSHAQPSEGLAHDIGTLPLTAVAGTAEELSRAGIVEAANEAGLPVLQLSTDSPSVTSRADSRLTPADLARSTSPGVAMQMLTSGTTGPPKRIPLLYRSFNEGFSAVGHYQSDGATAARLRGGVAVLATPLLHVSGIFGLLLNYLDGRRIALMDRFRVDEWVALIEEHRPRTASLHPTPMRMVLDAKVPRTSLGHLKAVVSGTAPVSAKLAEEFERTYGVPVLVVYGATEFAGGVAGWTINDHRRFAATKRGSVGRAHPGVKLRVVDPDTSAVLPTGATGILEVDAPQVGGDWMHTSDLAAIDEDGFLWIKGRADDVIIRGGFKVATGSVANALKEHPSVRDCGVAGVPDERLGEVPMAAVEVAEGCEFEPDALTEWLRARLAHYQVPVQIIAVPELPRTPSLKVSQPRLREILLSRCSTHVA